MYSSYLEKYIFLILICYRRQQNDLHVDQYLNLSFIGSSWIERKDTHVTSWGSACNSKILDNCKKLWVR